jgi:anti-sigma factor RsiW
MGPHRSQEQIDAYLDNELHGADRDDFVAHYNDCETCRVRVENRRNLLRVIRAARPEFHASDDLRRNIAAVLDAEEAVQRNFFHKWKNRLFPQTALLRLRPRFAYAWLFPILICAGLVFYMSQRQARADRLVDMAVETHQRQVASSLPVQFRSSSAREVARWCSSRLPFAFRLPTYQDDSGDRSKYELIGASLVSFRGKEAAYIAYRMKGKQISLVVVSADQAVAAGGEVTRAKSLVFHSIHRDGLEVFTWSVHHLTYALVSDVTMPNRQSCVVCHADPKDHSWRQSVAFGDAVTRSKKNIAACALPTLRRLH